VELGRCSTTCAVVTHRAFGCPIIVMVIVACRRMRCVRCPLKNVSTMLSVCHANFSVGLHATIVQTIDHARVHTATLAAYGSYVPSVANIYADCTIIALVDSATSFLCGFAVFSILGNMAFRQTSIASDSPELRSNICAVMCLSKEYDCSICATEEWRTGGICCGNVLTNNVAEGGIFLAFSVRLLWSMRRFPSSASRPTQAANCDRRCILRKFTPNITSLSALLVRG
jgi:hypothetical protein